MPNIEYEKSIISIHWTIYISWKTCYETFLFPPKIKLKFLSVWVNNEIICSIPIQVEVTFVDIQSPTYVKSKRMCEFWVRGTGHGVLENPKHSLSPNTTCLYHLQVNIWIIQSKRTCGLCLFVNYDGQICVLKC